MPKVNFNAPILGLDGGPILNDKKEPILLGKTFANVLVGRSKGDPLKLFSWAKTIYEGKELNIDLSDIEILKGIVRDDDTMTLITKAPIMEILINASNQKK